MTANQNHCIECGYEFVYKAEVYTGAGILEETRTLFLQTDSFDVAKGIGERIVSEAEVEESCHKALAVSLTPKTRLRKVNT